MKLRLDRKQEPNLVGTQVFILNANIMLKELALVAKYQMAAEVLLERQIGGSDEWTIVKVTVGSLISGQAFTNKDIAEILQCEEEIKTSCKLLLQLIEVMRTYGDEDEITVQAIEPTSDEDRTFHSCFISYCSRDQDFAIRLYADLRANGIRCWFAPRDLQGGKKIHEQIGHAISAHDRLLIILSDSSMNSEWVKTEIANAREREAQEKRQMLFPISLVPFERIATWKSFDSDRGKDSAREIREYFILDFSDWRNLNRYRKAFRRLLADLSVANDAS